MTGIGKVTAHQHRQQHHIVSTRDKLTHNHCQTTLALCSEEAATTTDGVNGFSFPPRSLFELLVAAFHHLGYYHVPGVR